MGIHIILIECNSICLTEMSVFLKNASCILLLNYGYFVVSPFFNFKDFSCELCVWSILSLKRSSRSSSSNQQNFFLFFFPNLKTHDVYLKHVLCGSGYLTKIQFTRAACSHPSHWFFSLQSSESWAAFFRSSFLTCQQWKENETTYGPRFRND